MEPETPRRLRPEDVTWEELEASAEASWRLTGPNSGGGTRVYRYKGHLFTVGYGDHSSLPGGAEQVIAAGPDNTPGFPPLLSSGHAAGCTHDPDHDWWLHQTCLLQVQRDGVRMFDSGRAVWSCSVAAFLRPDAPQRDDVLHRMGPVVLDELLRCAVRWVAPVSGPPTRRKTRPRAR